MLFGESKLFQGFQIPIPETLVYALIGIIGVFFVLAVLIGLLYAFQTLFKYNVFDKIGGLFKKKDKAVGGETVSSSGEKAVSSTDDEGEIVAAIIAVISAVYETEGGEVPPFVIRNIKRK